MRGTSRDDIPPANVLAEACRLGATIADLATDYGCSQALIYGRLHDDGYRPDGKRAGIEPQPVGLYDPRPWQDDALCAQVDGDLFYPEKGGTTRPAKAVCARCTVRQPCLDDALATDERYGVRGGLSERERRKLKASR